MIAFVKFLSTNENTEDVIKKSYSKTDGRQNNVALILLDLFIPWHQLANKFHLSRALLEIYLDYYWNIWKNVTEGLKKYAFYIAKNLFQIRKSQQDGKLDRDLRNVVKKHLIKIEIFDDDKSQAGNIKEDDKKKDKENIYISTADSYSYAVPIARMR